MKLLSIMEVQKNPKLFNEYTNIYLNLQKRYGNEQAFGIDRYKMFDIFSYTSGISQTAYIGHIKKDIKLTELELSMVCNSGFSYFGGESSLDKDGMFIAIIYRDWED